MDLPNEKEGESSSAKETTAKEVKEKKALSTTPGNVNRRDKTDEANAQEGVCKDGVILEVPCHKCWLRSVKYPNAVCHKTHKNKTKCYICTAGRSRDGCFVDDMVYHDAIFEIEVDRVDVKDWIADNEDPKNTSPVAWKLQDVLDKMNSSNRVYDFPANTPDVYKKLYASVRALDDRIRKDKKTAGKALKDAGGADVVEEDAKENAEKGAKEDNEK